MRLISDKKTECKIDKSDTIMWNGHIYQLVTQHGVS